jgi:hypothetical protein
VYDCFVGRRCLGSPSTTLFPACKYCDARTIITPPDVLPIFLLFSIQEEIEDGGVSEKCAIDNKQLVSNNVRILVVTPGWEWYCFVSFSGCARVEAQALRGSDRNCWMLDEKMECTLECVGQVRVETLVCHLVICGCCFNKLVLSDSVSHKYLQQGLFAFVNL